jgi:hypothetical protein
MMAWGAARSSIISLGLVIAAVPAGAQIAQLPCSEAPSFEILSTVSPWQAGAFGVAGGTGEAVGAAADRGIAYFWTEEGDRVPLALPSPPGRSFSASVDRLAPIAVSRDGDTVAGIYRAGLPEPSSIVVWSGGQVAQLGVAAGGGRFWLGGAVYTWGSRPLAITADGFKVVGAGYMEGPSGEVLISGAFEWFPGGGALPLESPIDSPGSWASGVSDDGRIIVGAAPAVEYVTDRGFRSVAIRAGRWSDGTFYPLADACGDPGENRAGAMDVSADGVVSVGFSSPASCAGIRAVMWDGAVRRELPFLPGPTPATPEMHAEAVSEDGRIVVGTNGSFIFDSTAFLWSEEGGTRSLRDLLIRHYGLADELSGWELLTAHDVSLGDDGRIRVVGVAMRETPAIEVRPYRAVLPCLDDDHDGLCNEWERDGYIDVDGDGERSAAADLILQGADPRRMNIYVEVDAIAGTNLVEAALRDVEAQFAKVPNSKVGNPDGRPGIILRLEKDETDLPLSLGLYSEADGCGMPEEVDDLKADHFGTAAQRAGEGIVSLKAKVYRYAIVGGELSGEASSASGTASAFGPDLLVTMGSFFPVDGTRDEQAATIMHELGHTFGLGHGGAWDGTPDHDNYKPNYHSVMNYTWQFRSRVDASNEPGRVAYGLSWMLDYSRHDFGLLDEDVLDEARGLGGPVSHFLHFVPVSPLPARAVAERGPVDLDRDGRRDGVAFSANLNDLDDDERDATLSVLSSSDDWTYLTDRYCESFRHENWSLVPTAATCAGFGTAGPDVPVVEMTPADKAALDRDFPIDCDADGVDDAVQLVQGLAEDLDGDGLLDACEPLEGDCDDDAVVDDADRELLIASFGRLDGDPEYLFCADLDRDQQVTFVDYQLWLAARQRYEETRCGLVGLELLVLLLFLRPRRRWFRPGRIR